MRRGKVVFFNVFSMTENEERGSTSISMSG